VRREFGSEAHRRSRLVRRHESASPWDAHGMVRPDCFDPSRSCAFQNHAGLTQTVRRRRPARLAPRSRRVSAGPKEHAKRSFNTLHCAHIGSRSITDSRHRQAGEHLERGFQGCPGGTACHEKHSQRDPPTPIPCSIMAHCAQEQETSPLSKQCEHEDSKPLLCNPMCSGAPRRVRFDGAELAAIT
jgi:hypothetical protein